MGNPSLSRELAEQAVAAVNEALSKDYSRSRAIAAASKSLRRARQTLQSRLYAAKHLYDIEPDWSLEKRPDPSEIPPPPDGFKTAGVSTLYNKETGERVATVEMPAPQSSLPMTYLHDGKQYLVLTVTSRENPAELVAFALPDDIINPPPAPEGE